jgi:hypothetical protein
MKCTGTNFGGIAWSQAQEQLQPMPVLPSTVLPRTQAGIALRSVNRLCPIPKEAWNPMSTDELVRGMAFDEETAIVEPAGVRLDEGLAARSRLSTGTRAIKRLLWSFWLLLLLPFLWMGSDWISLLILSQVFLVVAKLVQPAVTRANADASASRVLCIQEGEDCARG